MRKNLLTTALIAVFGLLSHAQYISVTSTEFLKTSENNACFYPRFSSAGDFLLVTASNYAGLRMYNFSTKALSTITEDAGAGYNTQISSDGKNILYTKTDFIKNLRNNSLVQIDRNTRIKKQLTSPSREAIVARFANNQVMYVSSKKMIRPKTTSSVVSKLVSIEDQKMVIYSNSTRSVLTPNGVGESYIWPSISPDMKNIVYTVAGRGTYVCKIDGSNVKSVGKLNAPTWLNNTWLIGMLDVDNGERLLSSTLIATTIDGKIRHTISTPAGKMAMYPAASADGKRIAFNTEKGEIYILNIVIK